MVTDPNAYRTRWGGALLALGVVVLGVGYTVFFANVALPDPSDDDATRAASIVNDGDYIEASSYIGVFGDVIVALGAFFLVTRWLDTKSNVPISPFFIAVALGGLLFVVADTIFATALVDAATTQTTEPALFSALQGIGDLTFGLGLLALAVGFFVAFWGETTAANAALPKWAAWVGTLGAAVTAVGAFGPILGVNALGFLIAAVYVVFLAALWMGVRIGFPNLMLGATARTKKTAKTT